MSRYAEVNKIHTEHRPMAQAALAGALTLARKGKQAPLKDQREGRIDPRRITRAAVADNRIFVRKGAPAPDKIRVTILVDASGSMDSAIRTKNAQGGWDWGATYAATCCQIARDLAGASDLLPWVTADISAFTTGHGDVVIFPMWKTGQKPEEIDAYGLIPMGGTEEGYAIAFAQDEMLEHLKGREQGLIIIISDGAPSEPAHVKSVVAQAKKNKIPVVSVALVASAHQPLMYGKDNVIDFDGNVKRLARRMAQVIGRVI
jgi:Mg-chelatase subunit ChlD